MPRRMIQKRRKTTPVYKSRKYIELEGRIGRVSFEITKNVFKWIKDKDPKAKSRIKPLLKERAKLLKQRNAMIKKS